MLNPVAFGPLSSDLHKFRCREHQRARPPRCDDRAYRWRTRRWPAESSLCRTSMLFVRQDPIPFRRDTIVIHRLKGASRPPFGRHTLRRPVVATLILDPCTAAIAYWNGKHNQQETPLEDPKQPDNGLLTPVSLRESSRLLLGLLIPMVKTPPAACSRTFPHGRQPRWAAGPASPLSDARWPSRRSSRRPPAPTA